MSEQQSDEPQPGPIPQGMRKVRVGEPIKVGDFKWDPANKKWQEIVSAVNIAVGSKRDGWYCRRLI